MPKRTVIKSAQLVSEGRIRHSDLLIVGQRIEKIEGAIAVEPGDIVVEAAGRMLLPGLIDDQVHFREPGPGHKGDMATESRAAVAGGITTVLEMPNTATPTTTRAALDEKFRIGGQKMRTNYSFYLGATNDNLNEILRSGESDACGVKVFMGASTGTLLVDDSKALEAIFQGCPLLIATHCEDSKIIAQNLEAERARHSDSIPMSAHPRIRSAEACYASSSLAVSLAKRFQSRLHVLHLSTAKELSLFESGPLADKRITAEACVHHLYFSDEDYEALGSRIKWNPAIKTRADRDALLRAVRDDVIDVIATDHAPHSAEEKSQPYATCPSGGPLVQHALPALLEICHSGRLSLQIVVQKMCHAPADLFGIVDRGYLREGYFADLVLVDLRRPFTVTPDSLLSKVGWSPFDGHEFGASVDLVWVSGELKASQGKVVSDTPGMKLSFRRHG